MIVHTASGSLYELDLEAKTVQRLPGDGANQLRRDNEVTPLLDLPYGGPVVGQPLILEIDVRGDGVSTLCTTTQVTRIEP